MPKRDESTYNIVVPGEPQEVTEIREKILKSFDGLEFVDEGHKYFLNGKELCSVSYFVSMFEEPFDTVEKARAYAEKHGKTPEYWIDLWRYTNLKAVLSGNQTHAYGESLSWIRAGHPENIVPDQKYKYVADKNWLIPTRKKEEAALKFWDDIDPRLHLVLPETKIYTNPELGYLTNYAGTFDLLLYFKHQTDRTKDGVLVCDWKTNADIYKDYSRSHKKMLKPPFDYLYDEPFGGYTIQQNAYAVALEDCGIKVLGKRLIWLKDNGTYEIVKIDDCTNLIRDYLRTHQQIN